MKPLAFLLLMRISFVHAYENKTPSQVHQRLTAGDSLLLLDVREISEYQSGHISEPNSLPVITAANMPWNSGVLNAHFYKLPTDTDIIVYCRSGGRSGAASSFLENQGFSRIFNMTSGFSGWSYESRTGGYGDGSGAWISGSAQTIACSLNPALATLSFDAQSGIRDSLHVELYHLNEQTSSFETLPDSSLLFRVAVLDPFGLSLFQDDSLAFAQQIRYTFLVDSDSYTCQTFTPASGWKTLQTQPNTAEMILDSHTLYKWILLVPVPDTGIESPSSMLTQPFTVYPNPFNGQLKLDIPANARATIYDLLGRPIAQLSGNAWNPKREISSGVYNVQVHLYGQVWRQKVMYQK